MVLRKLALAFAAAGLLSVPMFEPPETWPQRLYLAGLCALVTLPLVFARDLVRRRREVALSVVSTALALGAVKLFEGPLVRRMVPPEYSLDIDHRMTECDLCPARDGVALRDARPIDPGDYNVVFLGDSFAFGDQLQDKLDAFPFLVEQQAPSPVRVANFAWPSSGPVLQHRQLRDIGAQYAPDLVVVAFDMSDFHDDLTHHARLEFVGGSESWTPSVFRLAEIRFGLALGVSDLRRWTRLRIGWLDPPSLAEGGPNREPRHYAMSRPLAANAELMEVSWSYLVRLHEESTGLGARFAVVVLPRYQHYHPGECPGDWARQLFPEDHRWIFEPFHWFADKARSAPFPILSLLPAFQETEEAQTVWLDDPHYNEAGHRVAAGAILAWLVQEGLVPGH